MNVKDNDRNKNTDLVPIPPEPPAEDQKLRHLTDDEIIQGFRRLDLSIFPCQILIQSALHPEQCSVSTTERIVKYHVLIFLPLSYPTAVLSSLSGLFPAFVRLYGRFIPSVSDFAYPVVFHVYLVNHAIACFISLSYNQIVFCITNTDKEYQR